MDMIKTFWNNVEYYRQKEGASYTALVGGQAPGAKRGTLNVTLKKAQEIAALLGIDDYSLLFEQREPDILKIFWDNVNWHRQNLGLHYDDIIEGNVKEAKSGTLNVSLEEVKEIADKLNIDDYSILFESMEG